jgi:hypothetical protein
MSASIDFPIPGPTPAPQRHPCSAPAPPPLPLAAFSSLAQAGDGLPRHVEPCPADDPVPRAGRFVLAVDRVLREDRR